MRRTVIVMVKTPRAGRVKTRLGRDVGMTGAAWWFRHQSASLLRRLRDPRWRLVLAVTPDRDAVEGRNWPSDLPRSPQGRGDLGERMIRALRAAAPGPSCVIGADIPGIDRAHIARAFAALGEHDAVFGPAIDGGYWLIGLKHPRRVPLQALRGVRWSSEHALADSTARLPGHRIGVIDRLQDVDTAADLARLAFGDDADLAP